MAEGSGLLSALREAAEALTARVSQGFNYSNSSVEFRVIWDESNYGSDYKYIEATLDTNGRVKISRKMLPILRWQWESNPKVFNQPITTAVLNPIHEYSYSPPYSPF